MDVILSTEENVPNQPEKAKLDTDSVKRRKEIMNKKGNQSNHFI